MFVLYKVYKKDWFENQKKDWEEHRENTLPWKNSKVKICTVFHLSPVSCEPFISSSLIIWEQLMVSQQWSEYKNKDKQWRWALAPFSFCDIKTTFNKGICEL